MVPRYEQYSSQIEKKHPSAFAKWVWVVVFAVAFAWIESAVVVYLREIYFDGAFSFPLLINWKDGEHVVDPLVRIEMGREIATIILLVAMGWVAGRNRYQKFSYFIIAFGIWDIFYYLWLFVMIRWPETLMAWDLLFYVPLPWVGPVITPLLIAIAMVMGGSAIILCDEKGYGIHLRWYDMLVEFGCGVLMIVAFCWDWKNILQLPGDVVRTGIPNPFAWWLYLPAYLLSIIYFVGLMRRIVADGKAKGVKKEGGSIPSPR